MKNKMTDQLQKIADTLAIERDNGVTLTWTNAHAGGPKEPYGKDNISPNIINNDPDMIHMYRQYLFEGISLHPDLVHAQNTPQNFTEKFAVHEKAFKKHCKTWGFQTLYIHLFNSPDISVVPDSSKFIQLKGIKASYDNIPEANTVHIRMTKRPLLGQTIIHLFNYLRTETTNLIKRPRPQKQEQVVLKVKMTGLQINGITVYAVSPDYEEYDYVYKPQIKLDKEFINFGVSVDTYTLITIQQ